MIDSSRPAASHRTQMLQWLLFGVLISPLLYYWVYSLFLNPSRNYYTNDAEFPYFVNALAVFKGGRYGYIDHPGTPVQEIGTALLAIMYAFKSKVSGGFPSYYLEDPSRFFDTARALLSFFYFLTTCFFFWVAKAPGGWKNVFYAGALSVMYYAIHPDSLSQSTIWNHNSFNFPFGTLLLLILYRNLTISRTRVEIPSKKLILLGAGAGIVTSITIYMAGWVVGIVTAVFTYYLLQKAPWPRTIFAAALTGFSAAGGFFLAVLPIFDKLAHFRNWIISLLTHESNYLDVPENQPRLERLISNFKAFYEILPGVFVFFVLLVACSALLFLLFRHRLGENPGLWAVIIGLAAQSVAILLMFLDRPLREIYFLSIAAILPVWGLAIFELLRPYSRVSNLLGAGLLVFSVVGMTSTVIHSVRAKQNEVSMLVESKNMISSAIRSYATKTGRSPEDLTILYMYGSYSNCWGIRLGDLKSYYVFSREVERICPNQYLLTNAGRVDKFGNNFRIEKESWDMIFACETNMKRLKALDLTLHVEEHPELNWMCGKPIVVTHD